MKKQLNLIVFLVLITLSINSSSVPADCKLSGCPPEQKCMADGTCTELSVSEYCSNHGFTFDEKLMETNCTEEVTREKNWLCNECRGSFEYETEIGDINGVIYSVAAGIAVVLIIVNLYRILSSTDTVARENAKKGILFIILGLVLLIIAWRFIGLFFLSKPYFIPPDITTITILKRVSTTTVPVVSTTTTVSSICIGIKDCTGCISSGCGWCEDPVVGPPVCMNDCSDRTSCNTCSVSVCQMTTATVTTTTTTINTPCAQTYPACSGACPGKGTCKSDGGACKCEAEDDNDVLTILFVPLGYSNFASFKSAAEKAFNNFKAKSPIKDCQDPDSVVKAIYMDISECVGSCNSCDTCLPLAESCAVGSNYDYDYVHGIRPTYTSDACGCARKPGRVGWTASDCLYKFTFCHEIGHNLDLSHVSGCRNPAGACSPKNAADCNEPNKKTFLMTYCERTKYQYGPAGYNQIKTDSITGLGKWLKGC